jgi:hypothetical protein
MRAITRSRISFPNQHPLFPFRDIPLLTRDMEPDMHEVIRDGQLPVKS